MSTTSLSMCWLINCSMEPDQSENGQFVFPQGSCSAVVNAVTGDV